MIGDVENYNYHRKSLVEDFISCPWAPSNYSELEIRQEVNDLENIAK